MVAVEADAVGVPGVGFAAFSQRGGRHLVEGTSSVLLATLLNQARLWRPVSSSSPAAAVAASYSCGPSFWGGSAMTWSQRARRRGAAGRG